MFFESDCGDYGSRISLLGHVSLQKPFPATEMPVFLTSLSFISTNMYKKHFRRHKIKKNAGNRDPERKRDRALPQKSDLSDIILAESASMNRLKCPISPENYGHQEKLIIGIDNYLGAMFDPRSKGWSADVFGFLDPNGNQTA